MPDRITAASLLTQSYVKIEPGHNLREALRVMISPEAGRSESTVLAVVDEEGVFTGLVRPRDVVRFLALDAFDTAADDLAGDEVARFKKVEARLDTPISGLLSTAGNFARTDDGILRMVELASQEKSECLPVLEDDHLAGILRVADVFRAAAGLALTPETSGIRLEE